MSKNVKTFTLQKTNRWKSFIAFLSLFVFITLGSNVYAQGSRSITGTVTGDNEGLIGASILEKGTTNGTVTDFDGNFSLTVKENAVLVITYLGFKEKISWVICSAIALAFTGVLVLNGGEDGRIPLMGLLIVFLSALTYAIYMIIINKSCIRTMHGMKVSFYSIVFCSLFFLAKTLIDDNFQYIPSVEAGLNLALFAVVATVISLVTLVYAIGYIGSTSTAVLGSMEPLVAVAITVLVFHEPFTVNLLIGLVLIVVAVLLTVLADSILKYTKSFRKMLKAKG